MLNLNLRVELILVTLYILIIFNISFLSVKSDDAVTTEKQHELDKRKNPAKVKVEHVSLKDKIKNFREPHKKDQKETDNPETSKKDGVKEENELKDDKTEIEKYMEKSDHVKEGN